MGCCTPFARGSRSRQLTVDDVHFRSVPFDPQSHDAAAFDCGHAGMNDWLIRHAHPARQMGTAHTFVLAKGSRIRAYHSLVAGSIARAVIPHGLGHGSPDVIPAWVVARLAVDLREQGRGTGMAALADALGRLVTASDTGPAARFVIVDAIDSRAFRFYESMGFVAAPGQAGRLVMKMSTARTIVRPG